MPEEARRQSTESSRRHRRSRSPEDSRRGESRRRNGRDYDRDHSRRRDDRDRSRQSRDRPRSRSPRRNRSRSRSPRKDRSRSPRRGRSRSPRDRDRRRSPKRGGGGRRSRSPPTRHPDSSALEEHIWRCGNGNPREGRRDLGADRRWKEQGGMFGKPPEYDYEKEGPLGQTRVVGKVEAPPKDILATYDEIFAWGDDDAKQEEGGSDSVEAASSVVQTNRDEGSDSQNVPGKEGSEVVETAAKVAENEIAVTAAVPGEDALLEDFMAELRKARERVTTETPSELSGGVETLAPANVSTQVMSEVKSDGGSMNAIKPVPAKTAEAKSEPAPVDTAITSSDEVLQQQPKQTRKKTRRRHIKNMSVLAVSQNLKSMGLPYVAKVFEDEKIDGAIAQFLDDDLLRNQLKILTVSERQRTMHWISTFY